MKENPPRRRPLLESEQALLQVLHGHPFENPALQALAEKLTSRHEATHLQLLQSLHSRQQAVNPSPTSPELAQGLPASPEILPVLPETLPASPEILPASPERVLPSGEALLLESVQRSPTVKGLIFQVTEAFSFIPGQYVSLTLEDQDGALTRSYSIARRLQNPARVELWIKHVLNGQLSPRLMALKPGQRVRLSAARGKLRLHVPSLPDQRLVFVATGTGMSPLYALLQSLALSGHRGPVEVLWGVRQEIEAFALPELEAFRATLPQLRIQLAISDQVGAEPSQSGLRVTDLLRRFPSEALRQAAFHLAGNGQMIEEVMRLLEQEGTPATQCHHEAFFSR
ncbi:MAG: FAD-binding oxidoreductase [Myxococcota bacterium]